MFIVMGKGQKELIDQGYSKSSVYNAARKLKNNKIGSPAFPVSGELQELRHQSDIKIQDDTTELKATKVILTERVAILDNSLLKLRSVTNNTVDTAMAICLYHAGIDWDEAKEYADGWVLNNIKGSQD